MGHTWAEIAAHHLPGSTLAGVTGGRRASGLAADYKCRRYADVEALAADPSVDVVVLASPPASHLEQTRVLASAGKHLLVEKPMAQTAAECHTMTALCARAGVRLGVVAQHRFRTTPRAAADAIVAGRIGEVTMVRATGATVGFWDTSATGDQWKLDPRQQTAFASWAAHACDLIRWYVGAEADRAFALISSYSTEPPPGRSAMVTYRFAGGQMAQVWMSYDIPTPGLGHGLDGLIVGTDGMIEFDAYGIARISTSEGWTPLAEQASLDPTDPQDPVRLRAYTAQLVDLLRAVEGGGRPLVAGEDGLRATAMIEAAEASARTGRAISISPAGVVRDRGAF